MKCCLRFKDFIAHNIMGNSSIKHKYYEDLTDTQKENLINFIWSDIDNSLNINNEVNFIILEDKRKIQTYFQTVGYEILISRKDIEQLELQICREKIKIPFIFKPRSIISEVFIIQNI